MAIRSPSRSTHSRSSNLRPDRDLRRNHDLCAISASGTQSAFRPEPFHHPVGVDEQSPPRGKLLGAGSAKTFTVCGSLSREQRRRPRTGQFSQERAHRRHSRPVARQPCGDHVQTDLPGPARSGPTVARSPPVCPSVRWAAVHVRHRSGRSGAGRAGGRASSSSWVNPGGEAGRIIAATSRARRRYRRGCRRTPADSGPGSVR